MISPGKSFETLLISCMRNGMLQHFLHVSQQFAAFPEGESNPCYLCGQGNGSFECFECLFVIPYRFRVTGPAGGLPEFFCRGDPLKQSSLSLCLKRLLGLRYAGYQVFEPAQRLS